MMSEETDQHQGLETWDALFEQAARQGLSSPITVVKFHESCGNRRKDEAFKKTKIHSRRLFNEAIERAIVGESATFFRKFITQSQAQNAFASRVTSCDVASPQELHAILKSLPGDALDWRIAGSIAFVTLWWE